MSYLGLQNYILTKARSIARDASYQTIITGTIKASTFSGYRVTLTHSDSEVNNVIALFSDDYQVGDRVYLIITELDVSESNQGGRYYILGKVSTIEKDYTNLTLEDRFEEVEENGIVSLVFSDTDVTNVTDSAFLGTLNECSSMMLTGDFTFTGETEEEYGIKMTIQYGENETEEFLLTSSYFNGNPYIKNNTTYQKRIFATGVNPFRQITQIKVELVGENFTVDNLSLCAGNLLDISKGLEIVIEPAAAGNKNYFLYNNASNTVKLKALFYNNSILLDEENIHYYWFIKDDSITEDSSNYFEKMGKGWKILNSFSTVSSIDEKGAFGKFDDYKSSPSIEIKVSDLPSGAYENSVVCYIVYNKCELKSKNYLIYNLSAYNFSSTFIAKDKQGSTTNKILSADDELTLTFDVQGENQRAVSKAYSWQIGQEKIENYNKNFIKIIDKMNENNSNSLDSNENEVYVLNLNKYENKKINITCSVSVNAHGTTNVWNDSDSVEIESLIGRDKTNIIETKYINYYISERRNIIFTKDSEKISSSKTEISDNYWMTENENIFWINYSGEDISKDDSIFDNIYENESYYLYVTTAEVSKVKNGDGTEEVVRIADWEYPIIKRKVREENGVLIEELSEEELKQLNTFNSLTGGGTEQGVYYSEGDHGDLYINAEYINTGTFRVGNKDDEIFYASIDNPEVKIAGFTVDKNSMESGIKDTADYVHVGTDGIQAGENFKVVNGEVTIVGNISVTGGGLQEELDSIKQGWVDRYYISTKNYGVKWEEIVNDDGFLSEEKTFGTPDTDMIDGFNGWTGWSKDGKLTYVWKISAAAATFNSIVDPGSNNYSIVLMPDLEAVSLAAKNQILNNKVFVYKGIVDRPTGTFGGLFATEVPEGDVGRWCIFHNRTVISGGAIVTGSVTADQIGVNQLSAISADLGEINTGTLNFEDGVISENFDFGVTVNSSEFKIGTDKTDTSISEDIITQGIRLVIVEEMIEDSAYDIQTATTANRLAALKAIKSIYIPGKVKSIGEYAFRGLENVNYIYYNAVIPDNTPLGDSEIHYPMASPCIFDGVGLSVPGGTVVEIGSAVKSIPRRLFSCIKNQSSEENDPEYYNNITKVFFEFPSSCTKIYQDAFNSCVNLKEVIFPNELISIGNPGNWIFNNCPNLETVRFSPYMNDISNAIECFQYGSNLKHINLSKISYIPRRFFYQAYNLKSIEIDATDAPTTINASAFGYSDKKMAFEKFYVKSNEEWKPDITISTYSSVSDFKNNNARTLTLTYRSGEILFDNKKIELFEVEENDKIYYKIKYYWLITSSVRFLPREDYLGLITLMNSTVYYYSDGKNDYSGGNTYSYQGDFVNRDLMINSSYLQVTKDGRLYAKQGILGEVLKLGVIQKSVGGENYFQKYCIAVEYPFDNNLIGFGVLENGGLVLQGKLNNRTSESSFGYNRWAIMSGSGSVFSYSFTVVGAIDRNSITLDSPEGYFDGDWTAKTAIKTSSDQNKNHSIEDQPEKYSLIFDELRPVIFKYDHSQSDRYHTGLIAQDLEESILRNGLTTKDFAALCYNIDSEGNKINYGIRYEELVSLCIYEIQKNKKKIKALEEEILLLKGA